VEGQGESVHVLLDFCMNPKLRFKNLSLLFKNHSENPEDLWNSSEKEKN
jgi:hypothetical protein